MILANPEVNMNDAHSVASARLQSNKLFLKRVTPIVESSGLCTLNDFKNMRKVPACLVRIFFEKLL